MFCLLVLTAVTNIAMSTEVPTLGVMVDEEDPGGWRTLEALEDQVLTLARADFYFDVSLLEVRAETLHSVVNEFNKTSGIVAIGRCWLLTKVSYVGKPMLGMATQDPCPRAKEENSIILSLKEAQFTTCPYDQARTWLYRVVGGRTFFRASNSGRLNITRFIARRTGNSDRKCSSYVRKTEKIKKIEKIEKIGRSEQIEQTDKTEMTAAQKVRLEAKKILSGHVLTVVLLHRPPYVSLEVEGRKVVEASGILIEVLNTMAEYYNFTYTLKLPNDDQWGSLRPDGNWTGMVGEVWRRQQEMALGPTSITEQREKAIDFTVPFDYEPWDILIPQSIQKVELTAYLFPFSGLVWAMALVSIVMMGTAKFLMVEFIRREEIGGEDPRSYSLLHFVFDSLGCLISQANRQPQPGASRILAATWWIFAVIIIASYSGKLISSLTVRFTMPPVKSLVDMVESKKILWTYLANSAMEEIFKNSDPSTTFGKVGQLHKDRPGLLVPGFEEGIAMVRSQKFAYLEDNSWLEFAVADEEALYGECRMSVVRDHFFSTRFGIILQDGSPYRDAFTMDILLYIQSGLMASWKKKYWPVTRCISSVQKAPLRPLNITDLAGTFLLLLVGGGTAFLIFLVEILTMKMKT